ncbi:MULTISPECIES: sensor histidine kinase [unclassified Streptomyces]|uniref:sensor histidine kinase n=1 Tax=unclassified Streptomyces TaxID=2593676 RepID=UPI0011620E71|nr:MULTISPECIES: histidine kinase [unclassified Streptomyces]NMI54416.1 two-component sensor histidine kinase [Streptomyces sp. RLA2-12]QDN63010.1 two-component sensor histidine kinase [Streptomyces sp. S1D4-20]QDN73061.1 two-component sensor histidine kinase [Streptomyces sp. S1D4-14]QDO55659.1 two-component sensor histidine kinase [Streptomyces sp. RLB3-5]QDO57073.1 two-component sensor histidine kinase [Streptomyces sp. RLB1-8]
MVEAQSNQDGPVAPLWVRRPKSLHLIAYSVAALVFTGQIAAVILRGSDWPTALSVLLAGGGVALSWWRPWAGLVVTSAASFAVTAVGHDPLSVWMMAVLVLFSVTLRGKQPLAGTGIVAAFFLGAFMTLGGFRGGAIVGAAALFSAIAGGATGAALRIHREHWLTLEERAESAIATREIEATRRVTEERLRIARDLHDVIGHQVAMLSLHLGAAEIGLPEDAESSRQALVSARSSARAVVVETQRILALLRLADDISEDEALRPTPALSGLEGLIASFESIGLDVHPSIDIPAGFVEPSVGVTVYRVVQEALTNAYRHGEGAATVDVGQRDGRICVTVENRVGHPLRGSGSGSGLGLVGMRERVESSSGRLTIDIEPSPR